MPPFGNIGRHRITVYDHHVPFRQHWETTNYCVRSPCPLSATLGDNELLCTIIIPPFGNIWRQRITVYDHHPPFRQHLETTNYCVGSPCPLSATLGDNELLCTITMPPFGNIRRQRITVYDHHAPFRQYLETTNYSVRSSSPLSATFGDNELLCAITIPPFGSIWRQRITVYNHHPPFGNIWRQRITVYDHHPTFRQHLETTNYCVGSPCPLSETFGDNELLCTITMPPFGNIWRQRITVYDHHPPFGNIWRQRITVYDHHPPFRQHLETTNCSVRSPSPFRQHLETTNYSV